MGGGSAPQFKPPTAPPAPDLFNPKDLEKFGANGEVYNTLADVDRATILNTRNEGKKYFGPLFQANDIDTQSILSEFKGFDPNAANARDEMLRAGLQGSEGALGGQYGVDPNATARNLGISGIQYSQSLQDRAKQHLSQSLASPLNQLTQVGYTGKDAAELILNSEKVQSDAANAQYQNASQQAAAQLQGETASANQSSQQASAGIAAGAVVLAAIIGL